MNDHLLKTHLVQAATCPDCKGSGSIPLFTSAKPCAKCGGTGKQEPLEQKVNNSAWVFEPQSDGSVVAVIKTITFGEA